MWEYVEDYTRVDEGWTDLLNRYAEDGWRLRFVVPDEESVEAGDGNTFRLIFERRRTDEDDG